MKAELTLTLSNPEVTYKDNKIKNLTAEAQLSYALNTKVIETSESFLFKSPKELLDNDNSELSLKWYLERYHKWPLGAFKERAKRIEKSLPKWGEKLAQELTANVSAHAIFQQWLNESTQNGHLFTLNMLLKDTPISLIASSFLLSFPWELLYYKDQFLLAYRPPIQIRRNIIKADFQPRMRRNLSDTSKIRILALSPRPLEGFFDHRASIKPLLEAVEGLDDQIEVIRIKPTIETLKKELEKATTAGKTFHILHFDGHGSFDASEGKGVLCFEHDFDNDSLLPETIKWIYADDLANLLTQHHIPIIFLDACQTAQNNEDPNASVATTLLQAGISSVIAMTHSVLIETSKRFVTSFYQQLASGETISTAVMAGQKTLMQSTDRINIVGAGKLHMQDWFVPVLYQQHDIQLFKTKQANNFHKKTIKLALGNLPKAPEHNFVGRNFELFRLERLLEKKTYAVIQGMGGFGKTTIAVELAHWLVQSYQFDRCAFISLEENSHERAVLDKLGKQLIGEKYTVANYSDDLDKAIQPIMNVLTRENCLLVIDNMESLLANASNIEPVLKFLEQLISTSPNHFNDPKVVSISSRQKNNTRLLFTSRENLPAPFDNESQYILLGELTTSDAKTLIMQVMAQQGLNLTYDDKGDVAKEVNVLINMVNGHARAIVLLAQELGRQGITATTENLLQIMQNLEKKHKGKRELSLFSSVELSIKRLSTTERDLLKGFSVLKGGGSLTVIAHILNIDLDATLQLRGKLIDIGLVYEKMQSYLQIDPALANYLSLELTENEKQHYLNRLFEIIPQLIKFLYQKQFDDFKLATGITKLELPNILNYIHYLDQLKQKNNTDLELLINKITEVESLLLKINYPHILKDLKNIRTEAINQSSGWSHAIYKSKFTDIEHLRSKGDLQQVLKKASNLLRLCEEAGENAYDNATYDLSLSNLVLGQILSRLGNTSEALPHLEFAQKHFKLLKEDRMFSVTTRELKDCYIELGKLGLAEQMLSSLGETTDTREKAMQEADEGSLYLKHGNFVKAKRAYQKAIINFKVINDLVSVGISLRHLGVVHYKLREFDKAEDTLLESLSIQIATNSREEEAALLGELGNLYHHWKRSESAIDYFRQALVIFTKLGDKRHQCMTHTNLYRVFLKLEDLENARTEILNAIKIGKEFGHTIEPWKMWENLSVIEDDTGNKKAAIEAYRKAIETYLHYRQDGGENHSKTGVLVKKISKLMQEKDDILEINRTIDQCFKDWEKDHVFLRKLQNIVWGQATYSVDSPWIEVLYGELLWYDEVAELILLGYVVKASYNKNN